MKALVLAGGTGSRLRPFTHTTPKQLVPVANRPVLFHGLDALAAAGVTDIGIIVNAGTTPIEAAVGAGSAFGVTITSIPQHEPKGLAHCVLIARDFLGDDDFVMYLGDNVFADGVTEPVARFRADRPAAQLVLIKVSDPAEYGVAELDATGRVVGLEEKPARPRSDLAITGAYVLSPAIHEAVRAIRPSWRRELEITDALQWLIERGHDVRAHVYQGYWQDTGNVTDLLDCNRALLAKITPGVHGGVDAGSRIGAAVLVEPGATVTGSRIDGPAIIGAGSTVRGSYIGPYTSIGAHCLVEDARIEDSILLERSSIRGVRSVRESLIGRAAGVRRGAPEQQRAHRLVVGDDSRVELPA